ncbi:hypothetical protein CDL15_Pgr028313 [Punica granatum]|uniref:non-specific serine/threonine protein kinase n=2 Tax=Punica granatum TaxID=22663 RepID=A0A218W584_PUNGR|nr:hypothetical protein CDL15_Pgr028313 [Punica granatum]
MESQLPLHHGRSQATTPWLLYSVTAIALVACPVSDAWGKLPVEIGNLKHLGVLDLSGNKLSGKIPSSLGSCMSLEYLSMGDNMVTGPIPSALSSLKGIQELNLSHNRLSGQIPDFLEDLNLTSLDLSFNNFQGNLPTGGIFANTSATLVLVNEKLCGGLPEYRLPKCMSTGRSTNGRVRNVSIYTLSGILAIVFMLSFLCFLWHRKQRKTVASSSSNDRFLKVSYQELLKATDGFSSANLIGTGSFGSVFKGVLALDQTTVAVKVLNLDRHGASKSFIKECEALRNIRHRNLVKRVNIATDVACALDYLHHQCETPMVRCDLKPSNVLIDREMTGHVGDFGLVMFMPGAPSELISELTSSIGVKGSLGYIAPEYGVGAEVSTNGDVYSYGILVLEMFTGKRPTNDMFSDGLNLQFFAKAAFPERVLQIIDPVLLWEIHDEDDDRDIWRTRRSHDRFLKIQECLVSIVEIGLACSSEVPSGRMSMRDVAAALREIR